MAFDTISFSIKCEQNLEFCAALKNTVLNYNSNLNLYCIPPPTAGAAELITYYKLKGNTGTS